MLHMSGSLSGDCFCGHALFSSGYVAVDGVVSPSSTSSRRGNWKRTRGGAVQSSSAFASIDHRRTQAKPRPKSALHKLGHHRRSGTGGGGGGGGASNTGAGRLCDVPSGTPRTSHQSESEKKKSILHQATLTGSPLDFSFRPDFPVDQLDLNSSWNGLQMPDNSHTQQFDISKFLDQLLITPLLKGFLKNPECRLFH